MFPPANDSLGLTRPCTMQRLQGVGCAGGADPDHAEPAVAAALRGENACKVVKAALLSVFEGKDMAVTGELLEQAKALKADMRKVRVCGHVCDLVRACVACCWEVRQSGGEEVCRVEGGVRGRCRIQVRAGAVCIYEGRGGECSTKSRHVVQLTHTCLCCAHIP